MSAAPVLVTLMGPTASGKTDLAVRAAEASGIDVEAIVLDSRQLYRGLDCGTGKPDAEERRRLRHHMLDILDPSETLDAMGYRERVVEVLEDLRERRVQPLLVGGAGFYLRALAEGFYDLPDDEDRLATLREENEGKSAEALWQRLQSIDPKTAERLHPNDRYRVGRALEIAALSGRRPSELQAEFETRPVLGASFRIVHLSPSREDLHRRIESRTRQWLDADWADEIRALRAAGIPADAPGLGILGYREVGQWIDGGIDRDEAERQINVATRRYARQQETWMRKEDTVWSGPAEDPKALEILVSELRAAGGALDSPQAR